MYVRVRLTPEQLSSILATGSAACARAITVEAPAGEVASRAEALLANLPGARVARTADGSLVADRSGAFAIEEWVVHLLTFGSKTTANLRAARALRPWVVLVAWFIGIPAVGVASAAAVFLLTSHPPKLAPGLAFVIGVVAATLGFRALANRTATRWARDAHGALGTIERTLAETTSTTAAQGT